MNNNEGWEPTDEEVDEMMEDFENEMKKIHDEENRINQRILRAIKSTKSKRFYEGLMMALEEIEMVDKLNIVRTPVGKYQKENWGAIKGSWVVQHSSGDSGDSFYGTVCIELKKGRWLLIPFSC